MPRSLKEWIGKTDDTPVPPRVRLRVLDNFGQRCDPASHGCGRQIHSGDTWCCDHIVALINGGQNREANLHPLCAWCRPPKDAADVAEKSRTYDRRASHFGIKREPKGRPLLGTKRSGISLSFRGPIDRATGQPWRGRT